MARPLEKKLAIVLRECEFFYIPRGIVEINTIYDMVKSHFPRLCDDNFTCSHNQIEYAQQEWKHVVRSALQGVSKRNVNVRFTGNRGYWEFL